MAVGKESLHSFSNRSYARLHVAFLQSTHHAKYKLKGACAIDVCHETALTKTCPYTEEICKQGSRQESCCTTKIKTMKCNFGENKIAFPFVILH